MDAICTDIIDGKYKHGELTFKEAVELFTDAYINERFVNWPIDFSACKGCEYKCDEHAELAGALSGFKHCFTTMHHWQNTDFQKPNAMEIWNFRKGKKMFEEGRFFLDQLAEDDFNIQVLPDRLSAGERQWLQVEKSRDNDNSIFVEAAGLKNEMASWKFPLHFIDFETSPVALPFTSGRRPYEQVAFQFSHHIYHESGMVEHKTEYISNTAGEFPNFLFVRALNEALGHDEGTIFRFAAHENSILNAIIVQLNESNETDREELIYFIKSITTSTKNHTDCWQGERSMVDLNRVVKDYYYNPYTKGSNSIKAILPAALQSSEFLKGKYSKPLRDIGITSKNFPDDFVWIASTTATVNPYKMLPPLFSTWNDEALDKTLSEIDGIADGGAAMTAYAKLQYEDTSDDERIEITKGLLKYCELDTLAMVMIYEHFRFDLVENR